MKISFFSFDSARARAWRKCSAPSRLQFESKCQREYSVAHRRSVLVDAMVLCKAREKLFFPCHTSLYWLSYAPMFSMYGRSSWVNFLNFIRKRSNFKIINDSWMRFPMNVFARSLMFATEVCDHFPFHQLDTSAVLLCKWVHMHAQIWRDKSNILFLASWGSKFNLNTHK